MEQPTPNDAGEPQKALVLRPLQEQDFGKGFLELLSQLTTVGSISAEKFQERFKELDQSEDDLVLVIEDTRMNKIVGTAALLVMRKFIHECGKVGLVEDVVVNAEYRGQKLGKRLIQALTDAAKELGCYKVMLNCKESNAGFYTSCGYQQKEVQMVKYFE